MMSDIAQDAFHRVQRFSTDWHANTFAGSTVRKVTRGMWALDVLNDTLLIMLFPSLRDAGRHLAAARPDLAADGRRHRRRLADLYRASPWRCRSAMSSPAASLANTWDTRMGGALADAISCNAVVKGFGAEEREEERLGHVIAKWRSRTAPHLGARHAQRRRAGRDAGGAAHRHHRRRAAALAAGASRAPATSPSC